MIPLPWSISAIDAFINCPKAYQERWVLKNFKEAKGAQQNWGDNVHTCFELRQSVRCYPSIWSAMSPTC
jgi:hypothetical protein